MKDRRACVPINHKIILDTCKLYSGGQHEFIAMVTLNHNDLRYEIYNCLESKRYYFIDANVAFDYWNTLFS